MSMYQLFTCDICAGSRSFGVGYCEPDNQLPIINCSFCGKPTPHHYVTLTERRIADEKFWKIADNGYDPTGRALRETERGKVNYRHAADTAKPVANPRRKELLRTKTVRERRLAARQSDMKKRHSGRTYIQ